ncbi:ClpX C4-type zinc finger protein [Sphaerisporangium fuscum]|uniref:ClpX C4-type zinc finger protein n=1 Tax=Sphaerisporangium fuscum TaxID=2835868 RepID=UPI001BDCAE9B|nr:ClpX C4-type zinc finger protein [Sphaerisporangium fuscum]
MATTVETTPTVRCSFCGKANTEVHKVIAGAGVHICDECVQLCSTILEAEQSTSEPRIPAWETMTDEQILDHLVRIAAVGQQVEESLRAWVERARERGVTWARIGTTLGIARESAWERFSGEE